VLRIQHDALEQESLRNVSDVESKAAELNQFNILVAELEGRTEAVQQAYDAAVAAETAIQEQVASTEAVIQSLNEELTRDNRQLDAKQNEYNLTKSLVDNLEGFPESIRFLRKNAGWKNQYPLFSDILFCQEEYRVAIENYLEPYMNHYVVQRADEAVQAIRLLSDGARGRANFFVLDANEGFCQTLSAVHGEEQLIQALDIISVNKRYLPHNRIILHNVYLLDTEDERALDTPLPAKTVVILHKSSKFSKHMLGLSGGSVGLFEGKRIGRAKNLENLAKEI